MKLTLVREQHIKNYFFIIIIHFKKKKKRGGGGGGGGKGGGGEVSRHSLHVINCYASILPSTGYENNIGLAQSKADTFPSFTSHFSPFNCCLRVVL